MRFDVSTFDPAYPSPGITQWELDQILERIASKTTFWRGTVEQVWDGSKFVDK